MILFLAEYWGSCIIVVKECTVDGRRRGNTMMGWRKGFLGRMMGAVLLGITVLCSPEGGQTVMAYDGVSYDYIVPDADVRYYSASEISYMSLQTVCYAKNEIYARRGWIFRSQELNDYFSRQGWYIGRLLPEEFSEDIMNTYELENAKLLQRRENELRSGGYVLDQPGYNFDRVYYDLYGTPYSDYSDSGYILPDSDSCYLSEYDISGLSWQELCYARNEIYARHGRMFQSAELTNYFATKSWYFGYVTPADFSTSVFNEYEKANVSLLDQYEKKVYGDYPLDQGNYSFSGVRSVEKNGGSSYNTGSEYIFKDSDLRYLSESEVSGLSAKWLCYAKNEIYARHGRLFDSKELRDYFNSCSWYCGWVEPEEFSDQVFNVYELANIKLLRDYEYAYAPGGYQLYN